MFGYSKARLFGDVETVRREIESTEELQNWLQQLPEIAVEKEPADVLVVVFVIERLSNNENSEVRHC